MTVQPVPVGWLQVFSCVLSYFVFGMHLGTHFLVGVAMVVYATHLYSNGNSFINQHPVFRWMNLDLSKTQSPTLKAQNKA